MTWRRSQSFVDTLTLANVKQYLRVDFNDDDMQILGLINTSLAYVNNWKQRPSLQTSYTDQYGPFDTMPVAWMVEDTEIPESQPLVFYQNTSNVTTQLPVDDYIYGYSSDVREISICVQNIPDILEDSFIRVDWSVEPADPYGAITARKLLIANWYENREASVMGTNTELNFGVNSVLSLSSLVM